jgi:hypothetical protein
MYGEQAEKSTGIGKAETRPDDSKRQDEAANGHSKVVVDAIEANMEDYEYLKGFAMKL